MALALDLGTSNVRRAAAGSTSPNTGIAGFLKLFHFFPLQAKLVATAHIVPTGQGTYKTSRCYRNNTLPFHKYELVFKNWLGEQKQREGTERPMGKPMKVSWCPAYLFAHVMEQNLLEPRNCSAGAYFPQYSHFRRFAFLSNSEKQGIHELL